MRSHAAVVVWAALNMALCHSGLIAPTTRWSRSSPTPEPRAPLPVLRLDVPAVDSRVSGVRRAMPSGEPVRFMPSFRAARRAHGVMHRGSVAEYRVDGRTSGIEIRAMLHGLGETGQLESAARVFDQYTMVASADETLASIVLNSCAERGRMDLCHQIVELMRRCADCSCRCSGLDRPLPAASRCPPPAATMTTPAPPVVAAVLRVYRPYLPIRAHSLRPSHPLAAVRFL